MHIRAAELKDIPSILGMMRSMHSESETFGQFVFDEDKALNLLNVLLAGDDCVFFMVVEHHDELIAMMAGQVIDDLWTTSKMATDYGLYVMPEHRGKASGYWLLQRFLTWAEPRCDFVKVQITVDIENDKAAKVFSGSGLEKSGYVYGKVF